jgi:hypothetical protein
MLILTTTALRFALPPSGHEQQRCKHSFYTVGDPLPGGYVKDVAWVGNRNTVRGWIYKGDRGTYLLQFTAKASREELNRFHMKLNPGTGDPAVTDVRPIAGNQEVAGAHHCTRDDFS